MNICTVCYRINPKKVCAGCMEIPYCGAECAKWDWKNHQNECERISIFYSTEEKQNIIDNRPSVEVLLGDTNFDTLVICMNLKNMLDHKWNTKVGFIDPNRSIYIDNIHQLRKEYITDINGSFGTDYVAKILSERKFKYIMTLFCPIYVFSTYSLNEDYAKTKNIFIHQVWSHLQKDGVWIAFNFIDEDRKTKFLAQPEIQSRFIVIDIDELPDDLERERMKLQDPIALLKRDNIINNQ